MPNSKQIVYLSQSQYAELIANGSITVNGVTVTYDENDIYVTPQAEPITDVRVTGTSIAANGVANIPVATDNILGVVKTKSTAGIGIDTNNQLGLIQLTDALVKEGGNSTRALMPNRQHMATFYGLAKAAGHDEKNSTESLGTYTPEAKGAIQQMLGVSDLIATPENNLSASKAYAIGDVFTANGKLYKATAAIAADAAIITDGANANCEETSVEEGFVKFTDLATNGTPGLVKINTQYGIGGLPDGTIGIVPSPNSALKEGVSNSTGITPGRQHRAVFYGLAKAAGDATQAASDNAVGTYTDEAKAAIKSMIGVNVDDVQVNGISVVSNGIAEIPVIQAHGQIGAVRTNLRGLTYHNDPYDNTLPKVLGIDGASVSDCKQRTSYWKVATPACETAYVFYGLAGAAGDSTQKDSTNAVGTYTDNAKASIKSMLGIVDGSTGTVDVSGATPTINAVENTRYVCGEVTSLSFTPPSSGISIVRFTSGSTVTVLTIPSTVKFPEWFDPTTLETNTIYEICITDGTFGAVMSWAL